MSLTLAFMIMSSSGFLPSGKPIVKSFNYVGDIAPLNYFDPLKINSESNFKEEQVKYWRYK